MSEEATRTTDSGPVFRTPLPIRLFLVAVTVVLFKLVYDIHQQGQQNQQAIADLNKRLDALVTPLNEVNRNIERLNGGFSDMVKGMARMGGEVGKSARNVQMIQNDLHEEMAGIRKKVGDISNRVTTIQQDLRNPFRR